MLHLTVAGLSGDNKRLLLVSDSGEQFSLAIDARLRAALRGEHARLGQLEITMESTLRPRDIQTRIRGGESPESVAQAAQTSVDKIMPFAAPVLAERAHVADRAQRSSVRRKSGDAGARTLGDAVSSQLRPLNVDPTSVEWDSWRREDGRWTLTAGYVTSKRKGTATFAYDAPGNFVIAENDDARWLVGEAVASAAAAPAARDDLKKARQRRLTAVPEDELPLGDDAIELANLGADDATVDLTETAARVRGDRPSDDADISPTPEPLADEPHAQPEKAEPAAETEPETAEEPAAQEEPPAPTKRKSRGRASVPSWDEIMFGGKSD
ncbi:MAG: septation protein SepH [Nocardioides sp.]